MARVKIVLKFIFSKILRFIADALVFKFSHAGESNKEKQTQSIMSGLLMALISTYQYFISPFLGPRCRFYPSCSTYMLIGIQKMGLIKGLFLGFKRLSKCHPWHEGGVDLVPEKKAKK